MRKYTWTTGQWKWAFNENVSKAKASFPVDLEMFGKTFKAEWDGRVFTFKIYAIKSSARKWQVWARGLGGSEYRFTKEALKYIDSDKILPAEFCGGQEFVPIHDFL